MSCLKMWGTRWAIPKLFMSWKFCLNCPKSWLDCLFILRGNWKKNNFWIHFLLNFPRVARQPFPGVPGIQRELYLAISYNHRLFFPVYYQIPSMDISKDTNMLSFKVCKNWVLWRDLYRKGIEYTAFFVEVSWYAIEKTYRNHLLAISLQSYLVEQHN